MAAVPDDDVFTLAEIAAAARVSPLVVLALAARGSLPTVGRAPLTFESLVTRDAAVEAVRALASGATVGIGERAVVAVAPEVPRPSGVPVLVSTALHGLAVLAIAVIASLGWSLRADAPPDEVVSHEPVRLVYLALPGPGGGGGGGGLRQKPPPPKVQREGDRPVSSPLPARELPPPAPIEKPRGAAGSRHHRRADCLTPRRPADDARSAARSAAGAGAHAGAGRWRRRRHRPGRRPRRRQRIGHRRRLGRRHGRRALPARQRRRTAAAVEGSQGGLHR